MAGVEELDKILQSLWTVKPPGVTKSKIEAVTSLCIQNIQAEAQIIQRIASHYRNTPSTHKLGVLYVVDSVTRQWIEKARQSGQALVGNAAAPGTYAAGVHKMTEALPLLMTELLQSAPEDQKEKIRKLVDIWERGNTFPLAMLAGFKQRISNASQNVPSKTPPGSPPSQLVASLGLNPSVPAISSVAAQQTAAAPSSNPSASAILAALASMGQQNAPAQPPTNPALQNSAAVMMNSQLSAQPQIAAQPPQPHIPTPQYPAPQLNGSSMQNLGQPPAFAPVAPPQAASTLPAVASALQGNPAAQFQFLQALVQNGYTVEQIAPIISALGFPIPPAPGQPSTAPQTAPQVPPQVPPQVAQQPVGGNQNGGYYRDQEQSNHAEHQERSRQRSRSPDHKRRRVSPPNRRQSPTYGAYDPNAGQNEIQRPQEPERRGRNRRSNRNQEYRQRSPPPQQREKQNGSPASAPRGNLPKWIDWDHSIPKGHIKVLSRTLFVGGVSTNEEQLGNIFSRFGKVQTCMANPEKRHAFVKMENRQDAMKARQGIDKIINNPDVQSKIRSTRWGVGFGPRECCDYEFGISIIPISVLTDADRKWMLTAEFGGTGGKPIESGMVVEEPDIEIGAGVSSKAMSRRVGPELGGKRGGRHGRHDRDRNQNREQQRQRDASPRPEAHTIGVPPPVPGFGFQLPGMPTGYR